MAAATVSGPTPAAPTGLTAAEAANRLRQDGPNAIGGGMQPSNQPNFGRYMVHYDADGRITVKGLDHAKRMFDLTEGLIRRGHTDADIRLMLGGNAVRVLGQIWPNAGSATAAD